MHAIIQERLAQVKMLYPGAHSPDGKMCVMEAVAYVAGEPWSDHPQCACPVLTSFSIGLNDHMPADQRQRLLGIISKLVGTRSTVVVEQKRMFLLVDHALRVFAPIALEARGVKDVAACGVLRRGAC